MADWDAEVQYVTTRTPLRVSFAGGGTDLSAFYKHDFGAVFSTAINRYIYVTVKHLDPLFEERYRLNYSITEHVNDLDDIKNDIARECLRLVPVDDPIYIGTIADLPAMSGLGSSSSFAVGLLNALHAYRGENVSAGLLAEEAANIEIDILKRPIGKQDHYAAAYGGLNYFKFHQDGQVTIVPQICEQHRIDDLFANTLMFWTGINRDAGSVLSEQKDVTHDRVVELTRMRDLAGQLQQDFNHPDGQERLGHVLDENWQLKRNLTNRISSDVIDQYYQAAIEAGALGGKLCGAGGGGFLLFLVPVGAQDAVRNALSGLREVSIGYEPYGSMRLKV